MYVSSPTKNTFLWAKEYVKFSSPDGPFPGLSEPNAPRYAAFRAGSGCGVYGYEAYS
uniref:Uncharacterized protein n=1 Tax=Candidatus Methanogaster sp. ANME-2c ERB4 TaxID=2759911 RepID=A0A7G9YQE9_9EURY|nr:hypothetical protein PFOEMBKA_00005 [Methanosarcinales archaeon ANME-2c ERB4]